LTPGEIVKYKVEVAQYVRESVIIVVEADSEEKAKELAKEQAEDSNEWREDGGWSGSYEATVL
jgi:hypothetical protein